MQYENPWLYKGQIFTDDMIGDHISFVYLITSPGKKYVGKKGFWFKKTKILKGKKKRFKVPSDWKEYYGSSKLFLDIVAELGIVSFQREILHLCLSKGSASYLEIKEIIMRDALLDEGYANDWMSCKISRSHLKF